MKKIKLNKGKYALVDDHWFDYLNQWKWFLSAKGYAAKNKRKEEHGNGETTYMHRIVNKTPKGLQTDHINYNKKDNQEHNLRSCTNGENQCNQRKRKNCTSKYKGVSWNEEKQKWAAEIQFNNVRYKLGYHNCEETAARIRDKKARELHGEFKELNFK